MRDENKTKKQLVYELHQLRREIVQQKISCSKNGANHRSDLNEMHTELKTERADRLIEQQETRVVLPRIYHPQQDHAYSRPVAEHLGRKPANIAGPWLS